jgi:hypothetical protein
VAGYQATGGIHQALSTTADHAYQRLSPTEQQVAQQILLRLVNISDQGASKDTRRRLPRSHLIQALSVPTEVVETVLEVFGQARLLTLGTDTDSVEITHEALLTAWAQLSEWIETDRAGNLVRQALEDAATAWDRDRRDSGALYQGNRLERARSWASTDSHHRELSPTASAFLAASTAQQHRAKRRRAVLIMLSVLALVASGAAIVAYQKTRAAQQ